jgi:hypothetical protein
MPARLGTDGGYRTPVPCLRRRWSHHCAPSCLFWAVRAARRVLEINLLDQLVTSLFSHTLSSMGSKSSKTENVKMRVLTLGIEAQGKTTFHKQMKLLFNGSFSEEEKHLYSRTMSQSITVGLQRVCDHAEEQKLELSRKAKKVRLEDTIFRRYFQNVWWYLRRRQASPRREHILFFSCAMPLFRLFRVRCWRTNARILNLGVRMVVGSKCTYAGDNGRGRREGARQLIYGVPALVPVGETHASCLCRHVF